MLVAHRTVEGGVEGEDAAVGGNQPVPSGGRVGRRAHDRGVQVLAARRSVEGGVEGEDAAVGRHHAVALGRGEARTGVRLSPVRQQARRLRASPARRHVITRVRRILPQGRGEDGVVARPAHTRGHVGEGSRVAPHRIEGRIGIAERRFALVEDGEHRGPCRCGHTGSTDQLPTARVDNESRRRVGIGGHVGHLTPRRQGRLERRTRPDDRRAPAARPVRAVPHGLARRARGRQELGTPGRDRIGLAARVVDGQLLASVGAVAVRGAGVPGRRHERLTLHRHLGELGVLHGGEVRRQVLFAFAPAGRDHLGGVGIGNLLQHRQLIVAGVLRLVDVEMGAGSQSGHRLDVEGRFGIVDRPTSGVVRYKSGIDGQSVTGPKCQQVVRVNLLELHDGHADPHPGEALAVERVEPVGVRELRRIDGSARCLAGAARSGSGHARRDLRTRRSRGRFGGRHDVRSEMGGGVEARHALNDPNQRRGDRGLAGGQGGRSARGQLHGLERGGEGGGHGRRRAADGDQEAVGRGRPDIEAFGCEPGADGRNGGRSGAVERAELAGGEELLVRGRSGRRHRAYRGGEGSGVARLEHHVGGDIDGRGHRAGDVGTGRKRRPRARQIGARRRGGTSRHREKQRSEHHHGCPEDGHTKLCPAT